MPENSLRKTVKQLGITKTDWSYDLLLRIKHRFGISTESFLYRLDELNLITQEDVDDFRTRIHRHYKATNYSEPDGTTRTITQNARIGDLLLIAQTADDLDNELVGVKEIFRNMMVMISKDV